MPDLVDRAFAALSNGHRRAIVDRLTSGPIETPSLGAEFAMSKQALHKHLAVLERAGLVERTGLGRVHRVQLRPEPLDAVVTWASETRRGWEANLDRLETLLKEDPT